MDLDSGHSEDDLIAVSVVVTAGAGLVVTLRPLGTVIVVIQDRLDICLGHALGFNQLLLAPSALLAVLHVLPPLLPGPELAHLDLGGRVLVV